MTVNLTGISCTAKPVLTPYEQTMYNVCEEYFYLNQTEDNRRPILSQVRLPDVIDVGISTSYINNVQFNAQSFDIVITDGASNPLFIFEADGPEHTTDPQRIAADEVKDTIVAAAGLKIFRWKNDGVYRHEDVVRATADHHPSFSRSMLSPRGVPYDLTNYPDTKRTIEAVDIELLLIEAAATFPAGWVYATDFNKSARL